MKIETALQFIQRYDQPIYADNYFDPDGNGQISASETRIARDHGTPKDQFVYDLTNLPDHEFYAAIEHIDNYALKNYLYAKYPDFFSKWDSGIYGRPSDFSDDNHMNGTIDSEELWHAQRQDNVSYNSRNIPAYMDTFIADVESVIEQRDRVLFGRVGLVQNFSSNNYGAAAYKKVTKFRTRMNFQYSPDPATRIPNSLDGLRPSSQPPIFGPAAAKTK